METKTLPALTLGRMVYYKLTASDAEYINARRETLRGSKDDGDYNYDRAPGNHAVAGHIYSALVVRTWTTEPHIPAEHHHCVQLQVFLDGPDTYWATSRSHRAEDHWHEGTFAWPMVDYSPAPVPDQQKGL